MDEEHKEAIETVQKEMRAYRGKWYWICFCFLVFIPLTSIPAFSSGEVASRFVPFLYGLTCGLPILFWVIFHTNILVNWDARYLKDTKKLEGN